MNRDAARYGVDAQQLDQNTMTSALVGGLNATRMRDADRRLALLGGMGGILVCTNRWVDKWRLLALIWLAPEGRKKACRAVAKLEAQENQQRMALEQARSSSSANADVWNLWRHRSFCWYAKVL